MPARERFHVGDIVYVKPLGLVGAIQKVVVSQEASGRMDVLGYAMGDDLSNVFCSADWLELLEGGEQREAAERHEAVRAATGEEKLQ